MGRALTHTEAREVYDRIGSLEDLEKVIEAAAVRELAEHGRFREAHAVLELGFGTGYFGQLLFREYLPPDATYLGLDVSPVMVRLAGERLGPWRDRATLRLTDGSVTFDVPDGSSDRFVSMFVLDLLSSDDARIVLSEAHRVLRPSGLLCLASMTHGRTAVARLMTWGWERLHALNPRIVGGCRPVDLLELLPADAWHVEHTRVNTALGVSTMAVVAGKRTPA